MCLFVLLNTKEDIWKIPIDYHSMHFFLLWKSMGIEICFIKTFFQISSSMLFSRTNKHIEVWNNLRVSKY